jgi:hypothetical protein
MAKKDLHENSGIRKEYTLWRQQRNVWITQKKAFVSGARSADRVDEYISFSRTASFTGFVVLICAVLEFFFSDILPLILDAMPINFSYDGWNRAYWGDTSVVYVIKTLAGITIYGFIVFAGLYFAKLPKQLLFTKKIRSKAAFRAAVPAALSLAAIFILTVKIFGGNLRTPVNDLPIAVQTVFGILILPVLCEFAFRGTLLYHLRQYGDLMALMTVSVIASLLSFDVRLIPALFIASAVLCFFSLAAENVIVPIVMHVIMNIVIRGYSIMTENGVSDTIIYALCAVCLAAGIGAAYGLLTAHYDDIETETSVDPLPSREKLFCMITSVPVITALTALLVLGYL